MPLRRCLCGCGQLVQGSRCRSSRTQQRQKYHGDWPIISRQAIAAHVATYGFWCPGWKTAPHKSTDLTTDHGPPERVLCRSCNARKRNLGDG